MKKILKNSVKQLDFGFMLGFFVLSGVLFYNEYSWGIMCLLDKVANCIVQLKVS